MTFSISHHIYAATKSKGGFGVFFQSQNLLQIEDSNKELIKKNAAYGVPTSFQDVADVSKYPVNFAYYILEIEGVKKTALLCSKYTGATNHTPDRQGNFLSHTIVFEDYLENIDIPEIIKKVPFRENLSIEEEINFVPPSEMFEYENDQYNSGVQDSLLFLNSSKKYLVPVLRIIDDIISGWLDTKGNNITICAGTNQECINLVFALYTLIPPFLINHYTFSTYTNNPSKLPYHICCTIPECKISGLDQTYFKTYDVDTMALDYTPQYKFTTLLQTWIMEQNYEKIESLNELFRIYNITKLDKQTELPFTIEEFKESLSSRTLSELNTILSYFTPSQGELKDDCINKVRERNYNLYLQYLTQEMKKEVRNNSSLTNCISIIESYLRKFNVTTDDAILQFYKEFEQSSLIQQKAIIAAELLSSNYDDIKDILNNCINLKNYLFEKVDENWNEIPQKEFFSKLHRETIVKRNLPNIKLWITIQSLDEEIEQESFFNNIESHYPILKTLPDKRQFALFSNALGVLNENGHLTRDVFEKIVKVVNSYSIRPHVFWSDYLVDNKKYEGNEARGQYNESWSISFIKRHLIVFLATSYIQDVDYYSNIIQTFDEYESRWVLEKLIEIHNKAGYYKIQELLPKEKKGIWGFLK